MENKYNKPDNNWKLFLIVPTIFMFVIFCCTTVLSQRIELDSNGNEFQIYGYNDDNKILFSEEPKEEPLEELKGGYEPDFMTMLSMPSMFYGNATLNNVVVINGKNNNINLNVSCVYNLTNAEKVIINYYKNNISTTWINLPFENNKTNMLKDFSGNNKKVYSIANYNFSKNGGYDNYGSFEGFNGNDGLKINDTLNVTEFTISIWVKPKDYPSVCDDDKPYNFQDINGINIAYEYADWDCDTNNIYNAFDINWGSGGEVDVMYNEINVYNKFDFVWKKGEFVKVYMNGILNGTDDTAIYNSTLVFNSSSMFIGCRNPDCAKEYNGFMDDFKIYTRVLNYEEILSEYNLDNKLLNNTYSTGEYKCSVRAFTNDTYTNEIFSTEIFSTGTENVFYSQVPSDINLTNIIGVLGVNITYNISSPYLDLNSVLIYYKNNKTTSDVSYYENGTTHKGFKSAGYTSTNNNLFSFNLLDNQLLHGTYNYDERYLEMTTKNYYSFTGNNNVLSTEFFNVTGSYQYSFLEINVKNVSSTVNNLVFYACNSSYTTGNPSGSNSCSLFYTMLPTQDFNHCHTSTSCHKIIPLGINSNNKIGNVLVTPKMYIMLIGTSNVWNITSINNVSRSNAYRISSNNGNSYTNLALTIDSHIHQFDGTDALYYYACANNLYNDSVCTSLRTDLIELGGLPPSSVNIITPSENNYSKSILISYTEAVSPNSYSIVKYNISLLSSNGTYLYDIIGNNHANLTYLWNITLIAEDYYKIKVTATDSLGQTSFTESSLFNIDNSNIYGIFYSDVSPNTQLENSVIKFYVYTDLIDTTLVNIIGLRDGNYLFNITNASNNYNFIYTNGTYGTYCFKNTFYNSHNKNITNTKCFSLIKSSDFTTINSLSQSDSIFAFVIFITFLGLVIIGLYFSNPAFAIMGYMAGIWFGIFMLRVNYLFGVIFMVSCLLAMLTSVFK
jgi:hypothetical protein